jgi:hypothetical protein
MRITRFPRLREAIGLSAIPLTTPKGGLRDGLRAEVTADPFTSRALKHKSYSYPDITVLIVEFLLVSRRLHKNCFGNDVCKYMNHDPRRHQTPMLILPPKPFSRLMVSGVFTRSSGQDFPPSWRMNVGRGEHLAKNPRLRLGSRWSSKIALLQAYLCLDLIGTYCLGRPNTQRH